jgi:hypothetical protein
MANNSDAELDAAVSAFMKRQKNEPPLSQASPRADLAALGRTYHERIQAELAKAGFDFSRLEKLYNDYRQKADKLIKKQMPDPKLLKPTKSDQQWIENKQRIYELTAGLPVVTVPVVLPRPREIVAVPTGSLIERRIRNWSSYARWRHRDTEKTPVPDNIGVHVGLKFLFAWKNYSSSIAIIKVASADLLVQGNVSAIVHPIWFGYTSAWAGLGAYLKAHVLETIVSSSLENLAWMYVYTAGWLQGGIGEVDLKELDVRPHVRCRETS